MINPGELWRRLSYLANRRQAQRELAEELEAHRAEMGDRAASFGAACSNCVRIQMTPGVSAGLTASGRERPLRRENPPQVAWIHADSDCDSGARHWSQCHRIRVFQYPVLRPLAVKQPETVALAVAGGARGAVGQSNVSFTLSSLPP